jgi:quinol monooxygenase YgiN
MAYGLFSRVLAQPRRRDELVRYLLRAAELLHADPDCHQYLVATSGEPDVVCVFESWTDQQAHDASLGRDDVRALIAQAGPTVAGMDEQLQLQVHGGKGGSGWASGSDAS